MSLGLMRVDLDPRPLNIAGLENIVVPIGETLLLANRVPVAGR